MKENKYSAKLVTKIDVSLVRQWKALWETAENANPFNSYEWFLVCVNAGKINKYQIIACYKDKELVAILPLYIARSFGIKTLSTLCNNFLVDTAFLIKKYDSVLLKFFFSYIFEIGNLHITKIDDKSANMLRRLFPKAFLALMSVNPCLELTGEPRRYVSKSNRKNIQKIINRNINRLAIREAAGLETLREALTSAFAIDRKSSKERKSMDIFSKAENRVFFRNLIKYCGDFIRIYFLTYDGKPVSYQFGFMYKDIFAAYQTSFLYKYRKFDPGKTMLTLLLERLKNSSVRLFDFGGGVSTYKQEFTPDARYLFDLYYSKNIIVMFWWKGINKARRIKQIVFPKKHTRDHEFLFKTI